MPCACLRLSPASLSASLTLQARLHERRRRASTISGQVADVRMMLAVQLIQEFYARERQRRLERQPVRQLVHEDSLQSVH